MDHIQELKEKISRCTFCQLLGMELVELSPGYAKVAATVTPQHLNFLGKTHGGWLMSLADQAFSLASNTLPGNYVAIQFNIHFLGSPAIGERVVAQAKVVHQGKSQGMVEMRVEDASGRLLASATGTVLAVGDRASQS